MTLLGPHITGSRYADGYSYDQLNLDCHKSEMESEKIEEDKYSVGE
jgi:hypothetical protein